MSMENQESSGMAKQPPGLLAGRLRALSAMIAAPELNGDLLKAAGIDPVQGEETDVDEWAALHYQVFTHDLMPASGVFLEERGMLGGDVARGIHDAMSRAGRQPVHDSLPADHLANELAFMAEALEAGERDVLRAFWWGHGSAWIPLFPGLLSSVEDERVVALAESLFEAIVALDAASEAGPETTIDETLPASLARPRIDLDDASVGLAQIAAFLAVPSRSGLSLTRTAMAKAGRSHRLPTGFGSRIQVVESLLRSAVHYEAWPALCAWLDAACDQAALIWSSRSQAAGGVWSERWLERLALTRSVIDQLRAAEGSF